jgi:hypothetical protein
MFSFRKRPRANSTSSDGAELKTSPSLPELNPQGIPWPENLVDVSVLRETPPVPEPPPYQGAVRSSLHSLDHAPIPFHKPFRFHSGQSPDTPDAKASKISSLYMLPHPPSAFETWRSPSSAGTTTRRTQRRNRTSPAFNLMVRSLAPTFFVAQTRVRLSVPVAPGKHRFCASYSTRPIFPLSPLGINALP